MRCYKCEAEAEILFPVMTVVKDRKNMTPVITYVCKPCFKKEMEKE